MKIVPNREAEFKGIFFTQCIDERIEVELGKWLGMFSYYEPWEPTFPTEFAAPAAPGGDLFPDQRSPCVRFDIRFIGTPSQLTTCGYKGGCKRHVVVRKVLELRQLPLDSGA